MLPVTHQLKQIPLFIVFTLLVFFTLPVIGFAQSVTPQPQESLKTGTTITISNEDIFQSLKNQGLNINDYWTNEQIKTARQQDLQRKGVSKIVYINETTADVYITSLIASADKVIILAAIAAIPKVGPFSSAFAGMVVPILNENTTNGVIVRLREKDDGKSWEYRSIRSQ